MAHFGQAGRGPPLERLLLRAGGLVAGLSLLNKLVSFAREQAIAAAFGATAWTDLYATGFLLLYLVAQATGLAIGTALVPPYARLRAERGRAAAWQAAAPALGRYALSMTAAAAAAAVLAGPVLAAVAPGLRHALPGPAAATVMGLFLAQIPLVGLFVALGLILNAEGHFASPVALPMLTDALVVAAAWALAGRYGIMAVAAAFAVGHGLQLVLLAWQLRRRGFALSLRGLPGARRGLARGSPRAAGPADGVAEGGPASPAVGRAVLAAAAPVLVAQLAGNAYAVVEKTLGSHLAPGHITHLHYALLVATIPSGLIGMALGTVLLPALAAALARGDPAGYRRGVTLGLQVAIAIAAPAGLGLVLLGRPIVALLFEYGRFGAADGAATAAAATLFSLGLMPQVVHAVAAQALYARGDAVRPGLYAVAAALATVATASLAVRRWDYLGLPIAHAVGQVAAAVPLLLALRRAGWERDGARVPHLGRPARFTVPARRWLLFAAAVAVGCAIVAAVVPLAASVVASVPWRGPVAWRRLAQVLTPVAAAVLAYGGWWAALLLRRGPARWGGWPERSPHASVEG